jgi:hypothetical protein
VKRDINGNPEYATKPDLLQNLPKPDLLLLPHFPTYDYISFTTVAPLALLLLLAKQNFATIFEGPL